MPTHDAELFLLQRIVHERGQKTYRRLTEPLLAGKAVRDRGSQAVTIREIKDFLSGTTRLIRPNPSRIKRLNIVQSGYYIYAVTRISGRRRCFLFLRKAPFYPCGNSHDRQNTRNAPFPGRGYRAGITPVFGVSVSDQTVYLRMQARRAASRHRCACCGVSSCGVPSSRQGLSATLVPKAGATRV